jgi:hypothetical protein
MYFFQRKISQKRDPPSHAAKTNQLAYAHNFSPNALSTFITLVHEATLTIFLLTY